MGEAPLTTLTKQLGAHVITLEGVRGVSLRRLGSQRKTRQRRGRLQSWDGRVHPMRARGSSGIWEFSMPGAQ